MRSKGYTLGQVGYKLRYLTQCSYPFIFISRRELGGFYFRRQLDKFSSNQNRRLTLTILSTRGKYLFAICPKVCSAKTRLSYLESPYLRSSSSQVSVAPASNRRSGGRSTCMSMSFRISPRRHLCKCYPRAANITSL